MHQGAVEVQLAFGNPNAQLSEAAKQVFFHLPRHSRLLGTFAARRVGVGVGGEGAVQLGRLVRADAGVDFEVVVKQPPHDFRRFFLFHGGFGDFEGREAEFRNHVPVNGTQSFVAKERARPARERFVVEDAFVDGLHVFWPDATRAS